MNSKTLTSPLLDLHHHLPDHSEKAMRLKARVLVRIGVLPSSLAGDGGGGEGGDLYYDGTTDAVGRSEINQHGVLPR
jgi:hypothetical protein